jgi:hypothetical protein
MPVTGAARFERFFRVAKANGRDVIEPGDLPITKGLQERMHEFLKMDDDLEVVPLLEQLLSRPSLGIAISEETEARLPAVAGGLSVALAQAFKIIDPRVKNPGSAEWDQVFRMFELLL